MTTPAPTTPILLDSGPSERGWHEASDMLRCPQLWAYGHHPDFANWSPLPSKPLIRGTLFHVGGAHHFSRLQALQRGTDPNVFLAPADAIVEMARRQDALLDARHPGEHATYASHVSECIAAVFALAEWWARYRVGWKILAVEEQVRELVPAAGWSIDPAVSEFLLTRRLDLLVEDPDGYRVLCDHKTRGRKDTERQVRIYSRSGQMVGYHTFGRAAYGPKFGGVVALFATFQGTPSFEWVPMPALPWAMGAFADTIRWSEYQRQLFSRMGLSGWHYPKVMLGDGACETYWGDPCPGSELCGFGPRN